MKKILLLCFVVLSISCYGKTYQNKYAKGFVIEVLKNGYKLTVLNPFDNYKTVFASYNLSSKPKKGSVIIPVNRIAPLSSPFIAFSDKLNALNNIVAVENSKYVFNKTIYDKCISKEIVQIGENHAFNTELLITTGVDLVIVPGWENSRKNCSGIEKAGVTTLFMLGYMESHPLGRAEWIKVMALFLDKLNIADTIFNSLEKRYTELSVLAKKAQNINTAICGGVYKGVWYAPGADSYLATSLKNANSNYLFSEYKQSGSVPLKKEQVIIKSAKADIWIIHAMGEVYPSSVKRDRDFYSKTQPWKNDRVFSNIGMISDWGANDYWEQGIVNPDIVLADYIRILYPYLLPNHKLVYYRQIETQLL